MSRPPHNAGVDDPAIRDCPKLRAAAAKHTEKRDADQATADAATAAHPECSKRYREQLAGADERHKLRTIEARAALSAAVESVLATYQQIDPAMQDDEANRSYRKAVADAEKACAKAIADSVRIADSDRTSAWGAYRASEGYMGEAQ